MNFVHPNLPLLPPATVDVCFSFVSSLNRYLMKAYMLLSHSVLGSEDIAVIKMDSPLGEGRDGGESMHQVFGALIIGERASHVLEPEVGCETSRMARGRLWKKSEHQGGRCSWQKEQVHRPVRKGCERL